MARVGDIAAVSASLTNLNDVGPTEFAKNQTICTTCVAARERDQCSLSYDRRGAPVGRTGVLPGTLTDTHTTHVFPVRICTPRRTHQSTNERIRINTCLNAPIMPTRLRQAFHGVLLESDRRDITWRLSQGFGTRRRDVETQATYVDSQHLNCPFQAAARTLYAVPRQRGSKCTPPLGQDVRAGHKRAHKRLHETDNLSLRFVRCDPGQLLGTNEFIIC